MRIKINKKEYLTAHESIKENASVRASIKKQVAEQVSIVGTHNRKGGLTIEIVETKPTAKEGGIEIFARVFRNGEQVGFGKIGDIDIERFVIWNFPILVSDPQGDVVRIQEANEELETERSESRYREDPQEALIQVIEHNLTVMKNIHGDERIVKGKRGNTTSTFYPAAGANSPVDGEVGVSLANPGVTWASINSNQDGSAFAEVSVTTGSNGRNCGYYGANSTDKWRYRVVSFYLFDTSTIPDTDGVDSATLSLYGTSSDSPNTLTINIVEGTPASNNNLVAGDFYAHGDVKFSTGITNSSWNTSGFNDYALNASGLANITNTGISKFVQRTEEDIDNNEPTWIDNIASGVQNYYADETGTTKDPKLVVEHSVAVSTFIPKIMMS